MAVVGDIVNGVVLSVMPYGVFIGWDGGMSGFVHISELSGEYVRDITEFIKKGDNVRAKLIDIDENGKMKLSIKQATPSKPKERKPRPTPVAARPDDYYWSSRADEDLSFEDKLSRFKHESEEKIRDTKRRMASKRSGGYSRKGNY